MNNKSSAKIYRYIKSVETELSIETLAKNNMSRSHVHDKYELYFLIYGKRGLLIKNNFYKLEKGDLILISPGILHKTLDDSPSEYKRIVINFPKKIIENIMQDSEAYKNFAKKDAIIIRDSATSDFARDATSLLESVVWNDDKKPGQFESLLMTILYKFIYFLVSGENILPSTKDNEKKHELISDILEYINRNYTANITLAELSMHFYMSEFHLCRCFKKSMGRTIVEYINYLRIEKAKQMLSESKKPIKEIAKICGFNTTAHFNHLFKEYEKVSPTQFISLRK